MADSNHGIMRGLIRAVKAYPMLYDVAHPEYKSTGERDRLWGRIGRDLGITALAAKTKWRNLRDCYMKYLRSSQLTKGHDSVSTLPYKRWQWAEEMSFVRPHRFYKRGAAAAERSGRGRGAGADDEEEEDAGELLEQRGAGGQAVADDDLWQEMRRRRRQHAAAAPRPPPPRSARDPQLPRAAHDPRPAPLDATDHIFLGYAKLVKSFSPRRRAVFKLKIANLMMEAELEELNENSEGDVVVEMNMGDDPLEKGNVAKLEPEDSDEEEQVDEQE